ncbi:rab-GTPase-TBC domain-containing protein [Truncatella angustata]|uniref:Rab-GTPase-TBC domain-containing protein n=1 Tax=Truncatella angustata TaxID=152316 RepID=A0A9P8UW00_9PEZI|nr:rab-GTPase-TBC domain-containing protein [Truncatella angustata]KAH6659039.1 rab-GTPase-TBC domain-containing protein [Truncatella angustata]
MSWEPALIVDKQGKDPQHHSMPIEAPEGVNPSQDAGTYEKTVAKSLVIIDACSRGDIDDLKKLAVSEGGFLSDALRSRAWPVLLGVAPRNANSSDSNDAVPTSRSAAEKQQSLSLETPGILDGEWADLPRHQDEDQVRLDVDRSFIYYPNNQSQSQLDTKKRELSDLITETLRRHPYLCYFQGYHDICQVFLLVLPPELRAGAVAHLSALRIRDFMLPNLTPAIAQLRLIPDILYAVDPALCRHLSQTEPFFALSGTLTMYAHDIQSYSSIARLFDALLAREQVFSVYVFAQIVLNRRAELFDTPDTEPEMLHSILSKLPQPLDLDALITDAASLFHRHPPEALRSWRGISSASVMKTARDVKVCAAQTLDDGHRFFERQLRELQWAEKREWMLKTAWAYRRPARGVALAVLVGIAAVYLRKSPTAWAYLAAVWSRLG